MNIGRTDYFCGAFLAYLVSNRVGPTLFDAGENSKIIRFSSGDKDYKAFVKFCTKLQKSRHGKKWDIGISNNEAPILETFEEEGRENIVVVVCTDAKFGETVFAVFPVKVAKACLGNDRVNENRRISICHIANTARLEIYGTAVDRKDCYRVDRCCDKYFGFR